MNPSRVYDVHILTDDFRTADAADVGKQPVGALYSPAGTLTQLALQAGSLVAVRPSGLINNTFVADDPFVQFASYHPAYGGMKHSFRIYKDNIENIWFKAFTARVAFEVTIAMPTPVIGELFGLAYMITAASEPQNWQRPHRYQIQSTTTTKAGLATQWASVINNDPNNFYVTASVSGTNLILTAKNYVINFDAWVTEGDWEGNIAAISNSGNPGHGTYEEVYDLEDWEYGQRRGQINKVLLPQPFNFLTSRTIAPADYSAGYGIITISHNQPYFDASSDNRQTRPQVTFLCVKGADLANVVTLVETVTGKKAYDYVNTYGGTSSYDSTTDV